MGKTVRYFGDNPEFDVNESRWMEREHTRRSKAAKHHLKQMAREAVLDSVDDIADRRTLDNHFLWNNNKDRQRRSR